MWGEGVGGGWWTPREGGGPGGTLERVKPVRLRGRGGEEGRGSRRAPGVVEVTFVVCAFAYVSFATASASACRQL